MVKFTIAVEDETGNREELSKFAVEEPMACIIGRAADCTIKIDYPDKGISRHHCLVDINPPLLTVEDLGSSNGTLLNNHDISNKDEPILLEGGDELQIGDSILTVETKGFTPEYRKSNIPSPVAGIPTKKEEDTSTRMAMGQVISGYKIIKQLGEGGAGTVYLAEYENTAEQVALKTMLPEIAIDVEHKARFIRETKSMQNLQHPNLVSILDSGYSQGVFYFTLEYCNGGNLESIIRKNPSGIDVPKAVGIIKGVLDGLDYLHNVNLDDMEQGDGIDGEVKGLIHRDVKPENILIQKSENDAVVKIADFGLAKAFNLSGLRGLTRTGAIGGTIAFVCRQQVINYKYAKPEVDVWSAVAVLYYLLTGCPPRDLERVKNPLCAVLESDPVPIKARNHKLPQSLCDLIDSALDDKKELKFKTAKEFKEALTGMV